MRLSPVNLPRSSVPAQPGHDGPHKPLPGSRSPRPVVGTPQCEHDRPRSSCPDQPGCFDCPRSTVPGRPGTDAAGFAGRELTGSNLWRTRRGLRKRPERGQSTSVVIRPRAGRAGEGAPPSCPNRARAGRSRSSSTAQPAPRESPRSIYPGPHAPIECPRTTGDRRSLHTCGQPRNPP